MEFTHVSEERASYILVEEQGKQYADSLYFY
jgi:hypothetical protein